MSDSYICLPMRSEVALRNNVADAVHADWLGPMTLLQTSMSDTHISLPLPLRDTAADADWLGAMKLLQTECHFSCRFNLTS